MPRVTLFVDGFNLYHSIKFNPRYKWLDLRKLFGTIYPHLTKDLTILYFTAFADWLPQSMERHRIFIKALLNTDIQVFYGLFKTRTRKCPLCGNTYQSHEEKESDVNIAVQLLKYGYENKYDIAFVLSGDNDLIPAIQEAKDALSGKKFGVILPMHRRAERLKNAAHFFSKITQSHLEESLFPDIIVLKNGDLLYRPITWIQPGQIHCWLH